ncbi:MULTISPECIES: hypothetical protein [unclassified Kitasatospora]|uniref:hypothetical protein n=1 Tax=unclassified Kitasatospora TaxID=2633591 RepID=UPI00071112A3|nr:MULTISPECIES: hypothetical protein [unclassified Kitasatospora]KQV20597.1 hypothetical protein ASC99_21340 [Kitasatospora sp. Root107]KRB69072.1 hypothetical protein ASE03_28260 [Kitasatospora sp. Root187]
MTAPRLPLADATEAADLAAFLERLLRFDRAAAVRLQAVRAEQGPVLAVFGRLPLGSSGVLAVRSARLLGEDVAEADLTVSAGQLLESIDESAAVLGLPTPVTGPAWAGLLPPRSRWERIDATTAPAVMPELMSAVREFKQRTAEIPEHHRTRAALDALADEIWSRPLGAVPELPLRVAHAAYVIGFLTPDATLTAHRSGSWLRLSAPAGSVALRTAAPGSGLGLSPLR